MNDSSLERSGIINLAELSRKTGLVVRCPDSTALNVLFARLEEYDSNERTETLDYLMCALDETRASLGAAPVFKRRSPNSEP
jgi:hypothetical protein